MGRDNVLIRVCPSVSLFISGITWTVMVFLKIEKLVDCGQEKVD